MQAIDPPSATPKQKEILLHLYRFRYLKSIQLQTIMEHRSISKINFWLKDLKDKHYVGSLQLPEKGTIRSPYVYYAQARGIKSLRARTDTTETVLRRLTRGIRIRTDFIESKVRAAEIACGLDSEKFEIATSSSIANPESGAYWIYKLGLSPDLVVGCQSGRVYLVEVLVAAVPAYAIRKRAKLYLEAQRSTDWDLRIVVVCDNRAQIGVVYRAIRRSKDGWQVVLKDETAKIIWD